MSLRDRIPVEPLDGARLDRIEQRVVAEARPLLARPRRAPWGSWLLAGTAALAAAALVLALGVGRGPREAARPAAPVVVATDARGTRIDLGDAQVDVGPDTRFEVVRTGGGVAIELAAGDVTLEVAPRRGRPPLWVHAGEVAVRVVGTGFRVHRGATVEVEVSHGVVEVSRGPALARVATGERWSSTDGSVVALAAPSGDRTHPSADRTQPGGAATIPSEALALGPDAAIPGLRDRRPGRGPAGALPGATTTAGSGERIRREPPPVPGPAVTPPMEPPPPDLRAEVLAQPIAAAPPLPAYVEAGDAEARAAAYRRTAAISRGADAAAATWGLARTQATALGKDADALRTLDGYVSRFPSGAETEAVLWLRLRLLCKRQLDEKCRAAAHTYLARFHGTTRGDLATRVTQSR